MLQPPTICVQQSKERRKTIWGNSVKTVLANEWVLLIEQNKKTNTITSCFDFFTLQDVEPTNPWLRLGGEWICKAGRNHQRSSMVGTFFFFSMVGTFPFQILILLHFAALSFDTIQENCLNTWYYFFSNFHPFSFRCSFFWHNPSKLPQYLVLFLFKFSSFFISLFFLLTQSK